MSFEINPFDIAFFLLAPAMAVFATRLHKRSHVFIALAITTLFGWGIEFSAAMWIDSQWTAQMEHTPNPSEQLIQKFNADGAEKTALLMFGLPISFAYASICFGVILGIWRTRKGRLNA
jgi:hypothetical protein